MFGELSAGGGDIVAHGAPLGHGDAAALEDAHDLGAVVVYGSEKEIPPESEEPAEERIAFLKEQQWSLDFGTALAAEHEHILKSFAELINRAEEAIEQQRAERFEALENFFDTLGERAEAGPLRPQEISDELGGLVHSQRVLIALTQKGVAREDAYALHYPVPADWFAPSYSTCPWPAGARKTSEL